MQIATIEIRSRPIEGTSVLKSYVPHHTYILYTDINGKQYIIRGGTESNIFTENIKIIDEEYTKEKNNIHKDWDKGLEKGAPTHLRTEIARGSEVEMRVYFEKMQAAGRKINLEKLDYKTPGIGHLQNSNTVVNHAD